MKRKLLFLLTILLPYLANAYDAYDAEIDGIYYYFSGDEATVTCRSYSDYYDEYYSDYSNAWEQTGKQWTLVSNERISVEQAIIDGIKEIKSESLTPALSKGEGAIYNLSGQRLGKMQKGINIVNGKKILK